MPSPFPGMDPYLESARYWPDFHNSLAVNLKEQLNAALPRTFFASVETYEILEVGFFDPDEPLARIRPDLSVEHTDRDQSFDGGGGVATLAEPDVFAEPTVVFEHDKLELAYVQVVESTPGRRLVAQIEILSPANKLPGRDRDKYLDKRDSLDASNVSLVEIDLLRGGENPNARDADIWSPYFVYCRPAPSVPGRITGYHVRLQDRLPTVPVPLTAEVPRHPLDLQAAFDRTYDGGGYSRGKLDYAEGPEVPLSVEDRAFADECLAAAGLRPAASSG